MIGESLRRVGQRMVGDMVPWSGRSVVLGVFVALAVLGCGSASQAAPSNRPGPSSDRPAGSTEGGASASLPIGGEPFRPTGPTETAGVVRVVDGDTIVVRLAGQDRRLRYIGMDTPETVKPGSPVEWLGPEASRANEALVEGRTVVLEKDVSETDQYGRLLRYVWLVDGDRWTLVNLVLIERGFAQVETDPPDVKYADRFVAAQRAARDAGLGLWRPGSSASPR